MVVPILFFQNVPYISGSDTLRSLVSDQECNTQFFCIQLEHININQRQLLYESSSTGDDGLDIIAEA